MTLFLPPHARYMGDDDEKMVEGSDPKMDHAQALELEGEFYLNSRVEDEVCLKLGQSMLRIAQLRYKKRRAQKTVLYLNINTHGGDCAAGLMLGSFISRIRNEYGIRVNTRIIGDAASMGLWIAQFGDYRLCDPFSTPMLHDIQSVVWGDSVEQRLRRKGVDDTRLMLAQVLANRNTAGHTDPQWWIENYMDRESWFTPQQALDLGLIDRIMPGPVPGVYGSPPPLGTQSPQSPQST